MPEPCPSPDPDPMTELQQETERIVRALADRARRRAGRLQDAAGHHERLAAHLERHGIDRELARTRMRAAWSQARPATAIGPSVGPASAARQPIADRFRTRTVAAPRRERRA